MLVLTRYEGDTLTITLPDGRDITLKVVCAQGQIKLGFEAPSDVAIVRNEAVCKDGRFSRKK